MSIPTVLHPVLPQDYTQRSVKTYKRYNISSNNVIDTSSGYKIWGAYHSNLITPVQSNKVYNDPTNSFDGTYKHIIWKQINSMYYTDPYNMNQTLEHHNGNYSYKFLNISASILVIPQHDFGDSIKPGSVEISSSKFQLTDDQNGNVYDTAIDTGSFIQRQNLTAYWGFNETFKRFKYRRGTLSDSKINWTSNQFQVDRYSNVFNVTFDSGVSINNTGSGMCGVFDDNSIVITGHRDEFNFSDDFTISFWIKSDDVSDFKQTIISKNSTIEKIQYGKLDKYQNDLIVKSLHLSRSFVYDPINVIPYRFYFDSENDQIVFNRSNGITNLFLSASLAVGDDWTHICVCKSGTNYSIYKNAELKQSSSYNGGNCYNTHALTFGSDYFQTNQFYGYLDEIRFYDIAVSSEQIATLANNSNQSLYQTAVCGNVFYRRGNIIISGFDSKYHNTFQQNWNVKYRGTHVIYQNEVLVRIGPGDFNLSQNPTARQSYKSDLLINDMVTGSLFPYVTEIGFYDDAGNLLVVGKPNQPIQMRDDVTLNISTKWDY